MIKKLLIAFIFAQFLYSCKKENTNSNITANTWISGNWQRTAFVDTIFSGKSVFGIDSFPVNINANTLTFSTATSGQSTAWGAFSYSLTSGTLINPNTGHTWKIVQISTTTFKLILHDNTYQEGWNDTYTKQ